MSDKKWIHEILDDVSNDVRSWPEWMRRPEMNNQSSTHSETRQSQKTLSAKPATTSSKASR
jgi:hypothetical protein